MTIAELTETLQGIEPTTKLSIASIYAEIDQDSRHASHDGARRAAATILKGMGFRYNRSTKAWTGGRLNITFRVFSDEAGYFTSATFTLYN